MSRGIFYVTPEMMAMLLCLPEGSRLIPGDGEDRFRFIVDHPDIKSDVAVEPTYTSRAGSPVFVSWGQK